MPWVFYSLSAQAHLSPSFLLFNKHFPSTYYEPRTVLGAGESAWIRQIWPPFSYIQIEKTDNKCICKLTRCFRRVINVPKGRHREMEYRENMGKERETTLGRAVREGPSGEVTRSRAPTKRRNGHTHFLPPMASDLVVLKICIFRDWQIINIFFEKQCRVTFYFAKLKHLKNPTSNDYVLSPWERTF